MTGARGPCPPSFAFVAALAIALGPAAPAGAGPAHAARVEHGRAETDTVIAVRPGTRFELRNFGGGVTIGTWAKDAVRVHAEHGRRDRIAVARRPGVLRVEAASPAGPAQPVEYRLRVPAWLPVTLSGTYNDVSAEGLEGGLVVQTVRGDIDVRRALGVIDLSSIEGLVELAEANGHIKVRSVNDGVRLVRVGGDVEAEAVNGDIQMLDLMSRNIEATTVRGTVLYDGRLFDDGNYRFSTHSGDIAFALTDRSNATVTVSTYAGEFAAPFPIRPSRPQPGRRFTFALGNGGAKVDLESFQGAIQLFRPGDRAILDRFRESQVGSRIERARELRRILEGVPAVEVPAGETSPGGAPVPADGRVEPRGQRVRSK